ncbi:MAG: gamma-glutamyltransferase, partial [Gemmatimonadetes bacterium]|nr:gamma-glutamyltransferase [Gemmatimonadota bacterium]
MRHYALSLITVVAMSYAAQAQESRPTPAGRSVVYAPRGVIATSQPLASAAGLAVLERGGNAIDAAVTAAAVLNLVEPFMTGIGGDMFALLWSAREKKLVGLNASGRAGSLMTREELVRRGHQAMPPAGPETITVPGALAGWAALLERYGTLSLAQALEPAIQLAGEGFPVSPIIAFEWNAYGSPLTDPAGRALFLPGGRAPAAGEWFRNPDLAATLRLIATQGAGALYGGDLGRRVVDWLRQLGGFLTIEDLQQHRVDWVDPLSVAFRGYRLWELPPNGQGIAALEMLRILEPYDLKALGHNSADYIHLVVEAMKLGYADRDTYYGDPDFSKIPIQLISKEYATLRRPLID